MILRDSINKNSNCDSECNDDTNGINQDEDESEIDSDEDLEAGEKCIQLLSSLLNSGPRYYSAGHCNPSLPISSDNLNWCSDTITLPNLSELNSSSQLPSSVKEDCQQQEQIDQISNDNTPTMENRGFESMKKLEGAVTATQQIGQLAGGIPRAQQQPQGSLTAVPQRIIGSSSSSSSSIKPSTTTTAHIQQQHRIIDTTGEEGGGEEGGGARAMVRVRQRPHIPPKPQMDAVRYSMANVQESCDWELDTLLGELSALEQQLTAGGDQILLGLPTLPTSASRENSLNQSKRNSTLSTSVIQLNDTKKTGLQSHSYTYHDNNFMHGSGGSSSGGAAISTDCPSPDRDSAFGDSSSTESRNNNRNCRNSAISCSDSCRGSLNTPSPTQQASPNQSSISSALDSSQLRHQHQQPQLQQQQQSTRPLTVNEIKAAKIREALEKMREADIKKIYVKFFIDDGSSTISLLIDERWTVAECIRRIATKLNVPLSEHHAVVEEYPELYIKRIYEDHEYLVENIMMWTLNSQNKLYFTRRLDKYSFLDRPEEFLVTQKNIDTLVHGPPSPSTKRHVIREFFEGDNIQPPETEGWLFLKSDGKKSWKKHFFVLRLSGLYYCPKGKSRNSKDLQCLMNMQTNQVYTATDWKKKYKAPSSYGFAIKHPKIQVKASKYIKYVCTEDALTFHKWMVALRIAKNGRNLYENYIEMKKQQQTESNVLNQPMKVGIPQISPADSSRVSFVEMRKSNARQCQQQDPSPLLNLNRDLRTPISSRLSVATSNDGNSSSHQNSIIFDQCDDIITGTIKRAPCDIMFGNRQSTMTDHRSSSDGIASPSGRSGGTAESDSDEEQFPPPPPTLVATILHSDDSRNNLYNNEDNDTTPLSTPIPKTAFPQQQQQQQPSTSHMVADTRYHNGISSTYANGNYVSNVKPITIPVPPAKPQFTIQNGGSSSQMIGTKNAITTIANHQQLGLMPSQTSLTSLPKKIPPPPPPKRSDTTKLQSRNAEALHSELEIAMARRLQKIGQL